MPARALRFGNRYQGVEHRHIADPAAEAAWYPVETVSNSEGGFEKIYQGSCLTFRWPLDLGIGEQRHLGVQFRVTQIEAQAGGAIQRDQAKEGS